MSLALVTAVLGAALATLDPGAAPVAASRTAVTGAGEPGIAAAPSNAVTSVGESGGPSAPRTTLTSAGEPEMGGDARVRYDAGMAHYAAKAWPDAIREFRAGFAIDPRPEFLFAEAQATRLGGDCPAAMALYESFLATGPPAQQVEATHLAMARCTQAPPPAPTPAPMVTQQFPPARPEQWYRDGPTLLLLGGMVAAGVAGSGFVVFAHDAENGAARSPSYDVYDGRESTADTRFDVGIALLGTGVTLAAAAAWRYLSLQQRGR